jgi:hypothetical protein
MEGAHGIGMAGEGAQRLPAGRIPQAERPVGGGGEDTLAIGAECTARHHAGVAGEGTHQLGVGWDQ